MADWKKQSLLAACFVHEAISELRKEEVQSRLEKAIGEAVKVPLQGLDSSYY